MAMVGTGAADRLRQRREPAARARRRAAEGSGDPPGDGRDPRRDRPAAAGRELRALGRRRDPRARHRVVDGDAAAEDAARRRRRCRRCRRLPICASPRSRSPWRCVTAILFGLAPALSVHPPGPDLDAQGRSRQRGRRHRPRAVPQGAGGRAGRAVGAAPRRRRAVRAQPLQPENAQPRVRGRSAAGLLDQPVAERLPARAVDPGASSRCRSSSHSCPTCDRRRHR